MNPTRNLVATVAIIAHGNTDKYNISPTIVNILDNARIYTLCGDQEGVTNGSVTMTGTHSHIKRIFQTDLHTENTTDVLRRYVKYSTPEYKRFYPEGAKIGVVYDPIPFDKGFTPYDSELEMGIYMISVHEKLIETGSMTLIYPLPEHSNKNVDLTKISHIRELGGYLANANIDNIVDGISHNIPCGLTETSNWKLLRESVDQLSKRFSASQQCPRHVRGDNIVFMRLSYLAQLVKELIGADGGINFLDYSCCRPRAGMSSAEMTIYKRYATPHDIEMGSSGKYGGRRRRRKRRKTARKSRARRTRSRTRSVSRAHTRRRRPVV